MLRLNRAVLTALMISIAASSFADEPKQGFLGISLIYPEAGVKGAEIGPGSGFDTPGFKAGIRDGIITAVDGVAIDDPDMLIATIRSLPPGKTVEVSVVNDGKERKYSVTLGERPHEAQAEQPAVANQKPPRANAATATSDDGPGLKGDMTGYGSFYSMSADPFVIRGRFEITKDESLLYTEIDRLVNHICVDVRDDVVLAGTLRVRPPIGKAKIQFQTGDKFVLVRSGKAIKGTFAKVDLPKLPDGLRWKIAYDDVIKDPDPKADNRTAVTITVLTDKAKQPSAK